MSLNSLFSGSPACIPAEIVNAGAMINWREFLQNEHRRKSPVDLSGNLVAYDADGVITPFFDAIETSKRTGFGIGVTLGAGLQVVCGGFGGYLWCLDFDGFVDLDTGELDSDLREVIEWVDGYLEYSPSGTGAKLFFVTDKLPETKIKIQFAPSHLAERYPNIRKYREREIEVFSKNSFLAMTGDKPFDEHFSEIFCIGSKELDRLLERIDSIAKRRGGLGIAKSKKRQSSAPLSEVKLAGYGRLTKESLMRVLDKVDPDDESCWSTVANALARVYGEDGRNWFHEYSKRSDKYDCDEVDERFDRAVADLKKHPDGVGMNRLIELSGLSGLDSMVLHWEDEEGVSSVEPLGDVAELFADVELRQEDVEAMADAEILYPDMIVRGHVQAYVSPANGGKTTIMVYICEALASQGLQVFYVNVDGSPGDLKRHYEHAKLHGYKLIAPDARQGGSAKGVLEKMYKLAASDQRLSE